MKHLCLLLVLGAAAFGCGRTHGADAVAPAPAADNDHRLNAHDKLLFSIREDPVKAPPDEVFVRVNYDIQFRYSRASDDTITINARGKTLGQVKNELKTKLEADYYHKATIELRLRDQTQRSGHVILIGAISKNAVDLPPGEGKTIWEAVIEAGPNKFANLKKVKLSRVIDRATGKRQTKEYNLEAIKKGDASQDIELQDDDRIEVPERTFIF